MRGIVGPLVAFRLAADPQPVWPPGFGVERELDVTCRDPRPRSSPSGCRCRASRRACRRQPCCRLSSRHEPGDDRRVSRIEDDLPRGRWRLRCRWRRWWCRRCSLHAHVVERRGGEARAVVARHREPDVRACRHRERVAGRRTSSSHHRSTGTPKWCWRAVRASPTPAPLRRHPRYWWRPRPRAIRRWKAIPLPGETSMKACGESAVSRSRIITPP